MADTRYYEIYPVACTCGKRIGRLQKPYENSLKAGFSKEEALRNIGLTRMCCLASMQSPSLLPIPQQSSFLGRETADKISTIIPQKKIEKSRIREIPITQKKAFKLTGEKQENKYEQVILEDIEQTTEEEFTEEKKNYQEMVDIGGGMKVPIVSRRIYLAR